MEDLLYFFEEHCDGFGEGIGKSNGDKSPKDHNPSPASIRRWVIWCSCCRWHFWSLSLLQLDWKTRKETDCQFFFHFFHIKLHYSKVICREHKKPLEERSIAIFHGTTEQEYLILEAKAVLQKTLWQEYFQQPGQYVATAKNHSFQSLKLYLQLVTYCKVTCLCGLIYVALQSTVWKRNNLEKICT